MKKDKILFFNFLYERKLQTSIIYSAQGRLKIKNEKLVFNQPEDTQARIQDLKELYHNFRIFYWMKNENLV